MDNWKIKQEKFISLFFYLQIYSNIESIIRIMLKIKDNINVVKKRERGHKGIKRNCPIFKYIFTLVND